MKKAKKVNSQKTNSIVSTDNEMSKLIVLILVVALIFALFYVITLFVTKKDSNTSNSDENVEATIQYQKILAGNILSQKNSEYYVLVYFKDDNFIDLYKSYLTYYSTSVENAVPYYFVDMDDVFNISFVSEESKLSVTSSKDFKFSQTALLRIKDGKVISTYEGNEQITGKLGRMTK